ncbi:MAG: phenylpyruvate tautomerase MIF-related protein [Ruminococcus flavefaciens]|nr:phenylpyruvate tautomerase MIF-related protein [Ruminococcus flavefaciens]MCM1228732.1 phenylpyruvate tautomerase MIF-related protein [Ruminococcus flavefaciens]
MPFINLKTNIMVSDEKKTALKSAFGQVIETIPGKSEAWLMVGIEPEYTLYFKGDDTPTAMVDVSVFGTENPSAFNVLTRKICDLLNQELGIEKSRIYVKYETTQHWGWNGSNF